MAGFLQKEGAVMSNYFKEVAEANETSETEKKKTSTAFENDGKRETREVKRVEPPRNEKYEGMTYPGTNVEYKRVRIQYNNEIYEGVFPQFEAKDTEHLPRSLYQASNDQQFRYCSKMLAQKIERDPSIAKQFTERQLNQIKDGAQKIDGLTWHHTEHPGRMQLVDYQLHTKCAHTGGQKIWGGGSSCR